MEAEIRSTAFSKNWHICKIENLPQHWTQKLKTAYSWNQNYQMQMWKLELVYAIFIIGYAQSTQSYKLFAVHNLDVDFTNFPSTSTLIEFSSEIIFFWNYFSSHGDKFHVCYKTNWKDSNTNQFLENSL